MNIQALLTEQEERDVVAACYLYPSEAIPLVTAEPKHFTHPRMREILAVMLTAWRNGHPLDASDLARHLADARGTTLAESMREVMALSDGAVGSPLTVQRHCETIRGRAHMRDALRLAHLAMRALETADHDGASERLTECIAAVSGVESSADEPIRLGDAASAALERAEAARIAGTPPGIPTGLRDLDRAVGGLRAPRMYIIAGRPGHGKTALGIQIGAMAASLGHGVAMFSMEMGAVELAQRRLSAVAGVNSQRLDRGEHSAADMPALVAAVEAMQALPFWVDDRAALTIPQIEQRCRYLQARHGLAVVLVDYLQLARAVGRHDSGEGSVAEISKGLKGIAKSLNVAVIALAQLNRECDKRADHRPIRSDLRGSGQIEQDADFIGFLYRPSVYKDSEADQRIAELIVDKNRQGTPGAIPLDWDGQHQTFFDTTEHHHHH